MSWLPPKTGQRRGSHITDHGFMDTGRRGSHIENVDSAPNTLHPTDDVLRRASVTNPDFGGIQADSKEATDFELEITVMDALRLYKKGVAWSLLLSTAVVMEGYDVNLISNFYALQRFLDKFGTETAADGSKTIPASWRSGLNNGVLVGEILGLLATGIVQDRYGYKKTIGVALAAMIGFIFIVFFATNIGMLMAGEILNGLCWGVFQTITTAYASEVTPVKLRPYLTTYVNVCWVIGQLISAGVLRSMLERDDEWAYRIPFALQWIWPVPILVGCILCPESPWWLVRHGRFEDAAASLRRLTTAGINPKFDINKTIAMMEHTNQLEQEVSKGTSYFDCFKGTDLRRTEIVCVTWLVQVFCGSYFSGYGTVFYEQAGLPTEGAFDLSIGQSALGVIGTIGSWFLMTYVGRRKIYLYGCSACCLILLIIGFLGIARGNSGAQWGIGSLLMIFVLVYDFTVGPVCYSLVAELSSTRLKAKTIVLARNTYNIGGIIANVFINYQLTPTAWDWGAYCGFFWGGTCFLCCVWIYFRLPEPRNRTYGELDILFENKISARKFASTNVDIFRGDTIAVTADEEALKDDGSSTEKKGAETFVEHVSPRQL